MRFLEVRSGCIRRGAKNEYGRKDFQPEWTYGDPNHEDLVPKTCLKPQIENPKNPDIGLGWDLGLGLGLGLGVGIGGWD